jgi:hypothetical protein
MEWSGEDWSGRDGKGLAFQQGATMAEQEPFQPRGDLAVWRRAYRQMVTDGIDYGKEFPHTSLAELFGVALEHFLAHRGPLYRLMKELEEDHGRTLIAIPGKGYRISHPTEHVDVCKSRRRRGKRQAQRAVTLIDHTDTEQLQAGQQSELLKIKSALVITVGILSCHERRLRNIEEILRANRMM